MMVDRETFVQVAPWLAIAGNALLTPPLQAGVQSAAIFDACLWEELAACEDAEVANAADKLVTYLDGREEAAAASREAQTGVCVLDARGGASNLDDRVQRASVEFAHLFVGPPKPAVAPWETFYCQQGCAVGFGEATHQMRTALRDNGLELAQAGRQYEDHMGIELLLASELCRRAGEGEDWGPDAGCVPSAASEGADANTQNALSAAQHAVDFVRTRPLSWMPALREAVERESPNGFYASLLQLTQALLELVA